MKSHSSKPHGQENQRATPLFSTLITPQYTAEQVLQYLEGLPLEHSSIEALKRRHNFFRINEIWAPSWIPSLEEFFSMVTEVLTRFYPAEKIEEDAAALLNQYVHASSDFLQDSPKKIDPFFMDNLWKMDNTYERAYAQRRNTIKEIRMDPNEIPFKERDIIPFEKQGMVDALALIPYFLSYSIKTSDCSHII